MSTDPNEATVGTATAQAPAFSNNTKKKQKPALEPGIDASTPLDENDIKAALEASGYPVEMKLAQLLAASGWSPVQGHLCKVADDDSRREIDLLASRSRHLRGALVDGTYESVDYSIRLMMGVKKLHQPSWFVGILGEQLDRMNRRNLRIQALGGLPSHAVIRAVDTSLLPSMLITDDQLGCAFDFDEGVPLCSHYAIARRKAKTFEPWADGGSDEPGKGERYYDDIRTTSLARFFEARDWAAFLLTRRPKNMAYLSVHQPVLVIETPRLYVYEPITGTLRPTDRLALRTMFEAVRGLPPVPGIVDVMTPAGVHGYLEDVARCQDAAAEKVDVSLFNRMATEQVEAFTIAMLDAHE